MHINIQKHPEHPSVGITLKIPYAGTLPLENKEEKGTLRSSGKCSDFDRGDRWGKICGCAGPPKKAWISMTRRGLKKNFEREEIDRL